ncbi:MAG: cbb3-type cytochrome c oxidase N-terminal domain-containing protein [Sediminibacterium sp.]|nr:cbb3-type cytochrome c oxidase N-terminal domain-containing protein [Sediminibacterium sp.]
MNRIHKIITLAAGLFIPAAGICQEQTVSKSSGYFSNPLFLILLVAILVLLVVILAFTSAFKNLANSDFLTNKYKKDMNSNASKTTALLLLLIGSFSLQAQNAAPVAVSDGRIGGLDPFTFYFMLTVLLFELLLLGILFYQFNYLIKTQTTPAVNAEGKPVKQESKLMHTLTDAVAVEDEASIMLDHDYDGIKELDNNLPPWWKWGFYLTIVFAFVYLIHYHVTGTGALQAKEYQMAMDQAKREVDEYMAKSANNVDENTVKLITDAAELAKGKDVFVASCAACHGREGQGGVGPNLADEYWLHGGSLPDVFKSIKYGWVEKGMKSWKEELSPIQISQLTSFIHSIKGSNPPNPKAPQGDLYKEAGAVSDSTLVKSDSLALKTDSLLAKKIADSLNVSKK